MKKWLVILLLVVYAGSAAGVTIHYHYCCGHLVKISFLHFNNGCCCNKHGVVKKCCKDVLAYHANDNHRVSPAVHVAAFTDWFTEPLITGGKHIHWVPSMGTDIQYPVAKPLPTGPPRIFLLCRVFRI